MVWRLDFEPEAEDDLVRLDRSVAERVLNKIAWLEQNFDNITPVSLSNKLFGVFKLRAGDYRVLYQIKQQEQIINILAVEHRSRVYKLFQQRWDR